MSGNITDASGLAKLCDDLAMTAGDGLLTLFHGETPCHELHIKKGKLLNIIEVGVSPQQELAKIFAVHGLVEGALDKSVTTFEALWEWVAPQVPKEFHLHKERFRDIVRHSILRKLFRVDFSTPYTSSMSPDLPELEESVLPKIALTSVATELKGSETKRIGSFTEGTQIAVVDELSTDLSFEAIMLYQLLKQKDQRVMQVIQRSFFSPDKTVDALRELIRSSAVSAERKGGKEEFSLELGDHHHEEEELDVAAIMHDRTFELTDAPETEEGAVANGPKKEWKPWLRIPKSKTQLKQVTDEYLLNSLAYLVMFFLVALPWFFWGEMFKAFGR